MSRYITVVFTMMIAVVSVGAPVRSNLSAKETSYIAGADRQLPDGLVAVEYIESTGTQYIDTGIPLYSNMKIEIDLQLSGWINNAVICGANVGNSTSKGQYSIGFFRYGGVNYITSNYDNFTGALTDVEIGYRAYMVKAENITMYNGKEKSRPKVSEYFAGGNCFLFWGDGYHNIPFTNKSMIRVFSFSLSNGTKTLCDLQPVKFLNESNEWEGAMYDWVSGEIFRNNGTGAFVIGPDL